MIYCPGDDLIQVIAKAVKDEKTNRKKNTDSEKPELLI